MNPGVLDLPNPIGVLAGPGLGSVNIVNAGSNAGAINDDNTANWPKTHFISHDVSFSKSDYIDRPYFVNDTSGVTEFNFEDNIINGTPDKWGAVSVALGFGTGNNFWGAVVGGLDFDWPDQDSGQPTVGWTKTHLQYTISYIAAVPLNVGGSVKIFYSVDIPDWDPEAMQGAEVEGGYVFTIRTTPAVAKVRNPAIGAKMDWESSPATYRSASSPGQPTVVTVARPITVNGVESDFPQKHSAANFQETGLVFQSAKQVQNLFVSVVDPFDFE